MNDQGADMAVLSSERYQYSASELASSQFLNESLHALVAPSNKTPTQRLVQQSLVQQLCSWLNHRRLKRTPLSLSK